MLQPRPSNDLFQQPIEFRPGQGEEIGEKIDQLVRSARTFQLFLVVVDLPSV